MATFHAPGRVNLIGEHTDYSGGLVLPAAIDRGITLVVEAAGGDVIDLRSADAEEAVAVPADGSAPPATGWGRYVTAVAAELAAVGRAPVGLRGSIASDLPQGSGLSSSAALEVVVAVALCAVADLDLPPLEVAALAQRAELRAVGVPCGIMDQAASVLGRPGCAVRFDCGDLSHEAVPLPDGLALAIIDTGVPRRLEESGYATRRRELEAGIAALGGRSLRGLDPDGAHEAVLAAGAGEVAARRVRHVTAENTRVDAVVAALTRSGGPDLDALGACFAAGHASLRDDFAVSTPELDLLVALAVDAGAVAARMTGGGFGGAIVALVERDRAEALLAAVLAAYAAQGGRGSGLLTEAAAGAGPRP